MSSKLFVLISCGGMEWSITPKGCAVKGPEIHEALETSGKVGSFVYGSDAKAQQQFHRLSV
jgi:hypothetical protein